MHVFWHGKRQPCITTAPIRMGRLLGHRHLSLVYSRHAVGLLLGALLGAVFEPLLLRESLRRDNLREALKSRSLEPWTQMLAMGIKEPRPSKRCWARPQGRTRLILTRRRVGLQSRDDPGLRNLVQATVIQIHGREKQRVVLLRHLGRNSLHDFAVDRLLVVRNQVLVEELLDLVRREPAGSSMSAIFTPRQRHRRRSLTSSKCPG